MPASIHFILGSENENISRGHRLRRRCPQYFELLQQRERQSAGVSVRHEQ